MAYSNSETKGVSGEQNGRSSKSEAEAKISKYARALIGNWAWAMTKGEVIVGHGSLVLDEHGEIEMINQVTNIRAFGNHQISYSDPREGWILELRAKDEKGMTEFEFLFVSENGGVFRFIDQRGVMMKLSR